MGVAIPDPTIEVEVKFDVLDRAAARSTLLAAHLGQIAAAGPAARLRLVDRYLDTPDGRLREAGWAARIRTIGSSSRIQLKELASTDAVGVARRQEHEGPAEAGVVPDDWPVSAARRRLLQLLHGEPPVETLVLRQDRLTRQFGDLSGRLELSLDRVEVLVDGRPVARRLVLEVEQQDATEVAFRRALAHLGALPHLAPARSTKLAWGMAVQRRRTAEDGLPILDDADSTFLADDPTAEVGRTILATQLRTMIERERVVRQQAGPEEIRRLRVATRRIRATWRTFDGSFAGLRPERLGRGLRRFARILNVVRDLDVLLAHVDGYLDGLAPRDDGPAHADDGSPYLDSGPAVPEPGASHPDRVALETYRTACEARRAAALATLLAECSRARHRRLLGTFAEFVQSPGGDVRPVAPPSPRRLSDELGGWIWSGFERLVGWQPLLETAETETLHDLRLEAKRLRDLLQVVAPITGPTTAAVTEALAGLQDALGAMNDAVVTAATVRAYLVESASSLSAGDAEAIERFALAQEDRISAARARVPVAWRRVTEPEGRRRVARLIGNI